MSNDSILPVRKRIEVPLAPVAAFDLFTSKMESWWPFETHSVFLSEKVSFSFEYRDGGRLVETGPDGEDTIWGTVLSFDPPNLVRFTWHPGRESETAQEVEVTFVASEAGTIVSLVHSGWELLGERAAEAREGYLTGWDLVFADRFGTAAANERAH